MQVIETHHAYLTAYEVGKIVDKRLRAAKPYNDPRDKKYLSDFKRVEMARKNMFLSLDANCPEPLEGVEDDDIGMRIKNFVKEVQEVAPGISPEKIRDLIAYRPTIDAQIIAIFSDPDDWEFIQEYEEQVLELVKKWIPRKEKIVTNEEAEAEEKE